MKSMVKSSARGAAIMIAFAVVFTGLMAVVYGLTKTIVQANEDHARLALITQVLPAGSYDNNLLADVKTITDPALGDGEHHVYLARKSGKVVAVVAEATAPDGYSGAIDILVGVFAQGDIAGVRVVKHKETPGLGDYIEIAKSEWIRIFDGKSLKAPSEQGWAVKKDGGEFTHMAGATISPRAVVKATHRALNYVEAHKAEWLGEQR